MKYYSQADEDKYLYENLISLVPPKHQRYIEVGALDGVRYSNTKFLEDTLGWTGVLIEPNPVSFSKLSSNRPGNILSPCLISNSTEELEYTYFENDNLAAVSGATSTLTQKNKDVFFENDDEWLIKARSSFLKTCVLESVSLDSVLKETKLDGFGFCSIDVEGHELQVLESFSFNIEISIILIEKNPHDNQILELMLSKGYSFFDSVAHNDVFISRNYAELLRNAQIQKVA